MHRPSLLCSGHDMPLTCKAQHHTANWEQGHEAAAHKATVTCTVKSIHTDCRHEKTPPVVVFLSGFLHRCPLETCCKETQTPLPQAWVGFCFVRQREADEMSSSSMLRELHLLPGLTLRAQHHRPGLAGKDL